VTEVPDPWIQEPTDAIIKVTSTAIWGSDLHLYEVLGPYLKSGDVLGHEPMAIVMEVGAAVTHINPATGSSCRSTFPAGPMLDVQPRPVRALRDI
jgi:threonine dehydrogenase-like Zn-dependent dehydrogenase